MCWQGFSLKFFGFLQGMTEKISRKIAAHSVESSITCFSCKSHLYSTSQGLRLRLVWAGGRVEAAQSLGLASLYVLGLQDRVLWMQLMMLAGELWHESI
jgi:hypothetical protein